METAKEQECIEQAKSHYHLSKRGAQNLLYRDVWGPREKSMGNPWSPDNPSGTVILRLAENSLLHEEVIEFFNTQMAVHPIDHLTYSTGPRGSRRLRRAAATFLTDEFQSKDIITSDNILITPGVASAIDALAWSICDDGDGILVPQPFYNGFTVDLLNRSNAQIIGLKYQEIEGYSGLDDLFCPDVNAKALQAALCKAENDGITIRALLISNPHNPLGRCYVRFIPSHLLVTSKLTIQKPPETLKEFISFCGRNRLHFISDEIYAKSVFLNPAISSPTPFISTLALDVRALIEPAFMHVLYGASKDFCANGLRLGLVCTKNDGIMGAMSSIGIFSWSPHVLQDVWAAMLEDKKWLRSFMDKKAKLMADHYSIATSFFCDRGIRYYEMNAGLFIWVDLRHLLVPKPSSRQEASYNALKVGSPDASIYKRRELRVAEICTKNGVMIAPGSVYVPEEFGWFRVTFTLEKRALKEGLDRLWSSLVEVESELQERQ